MPPSRELSLQLYFMENVWRQEDIRRLPSAKAARVLATPLQAWSLAPVAQGGWALQEYVNCGDSLGSCWYPWSRHCLEFSDSFDSIPGSLLLGLPSGWSHSVTFKTLVML